MSNPFGIEEGADRYVSDIEQHLRSTDTLLNKMEDEIDQMVRLNWRGNQAGAFHTTMANHLQHLREIHAKTDKLGQDAIQFMNNQRNVDQSV